MALELFSRHSVATEAVKFREEGKKKYRTNDTILPVTTISCFKHVTSNCHIS